MPAILFDPIQRHRSYRAASEFARNPDGTSAQSDQSQTTLSGVTTLKRHIFVAALSVALAAAFSAPVLAQSKPPIKLGHVAIMTGPASSYGKLQAVIVKIAVEDVNAKGGVNGSLIQVQTEDSQLDPGQAVLLFRKLIGEGAFAVVGPMSGTQWETVSPLANQLKMLAMTVNASKPGITVRPWTLRLGPADDTAIPEGVAVFVKKFPKVKRVVIVADVREASGKSGAEIFETLAKKNGLQGVSIAMLRGLPIASRPATTESEGFMKGSGADRAAARHRGHHIRFIQLDEA
ncbi:MAG: amino acid ABC transporter substrate-binding protein [Betaproteobacteria bacterium]|nr:amino acid ABC transporter substrate-binding protein [Betaproteobacteria bacterium]